MPSTPGVAVDLTVEEPTMALDMARPVLGIVLVGSVQVAVGAALQKQQEPRVKRSFPGSLACAAWAGSAPAPERPIVLRCRLASTPAPG